MAPSSSSAPRLRRAERVPRLCACRLVHYSAAGEAVRSVVKPTYHLQEDMGILKQ